MNVEVDPGQDGAAGEATEHGNNWGQVDLWRVNKYCDQTVTIVLVRDAFHYFLCHQAKQGLGGCGFEHNEGSVLAQEYVDVASSQHYCYLIAKLVSQLVQLALQCQTDHIYFFFVHHYQMEGMGRGKRLYAMDFEKFYPLMAGLGTVQKLQQVVARHIYFYQVTCKEAAAQQAHCFATGFLDMVLEKFNSIRCKPTKFSY